MFAILACLVLRAGSEPNPPFWPTSVNVFSPQDPNIQATVNEAFAINGGSGNNGQFSDKRFAFLFLPGVYNVEVPVGYYTTVHGLGESPYDVVFSSDRGVFCEEGDFGGGGALVTFWRSAENFQTIASHAWLGPPQNGSCTFFQDSNCYGNDLSSEPCPDVGSCCIRCANTSGCLGFTQDIHDAHGGDTPTCFLKTKCASLQSQPGLQSGMVGSPYEGGQGMMWAVSQAAPLRRVIVDGDLLLTEYTGGSHAGYASGGFIANSEITGTVRAGTQQQFMTRNCKIGGWVNGSWNMVFVGTENAPINHCGGVYENEVAVTTVDETPLVVEKPFITVEKKNDHYLYNLQVPQPQQKVRGVDFTLKNVVTVPFDRVFVADDSLNASAINSKLSQGLHVVFAPGTYLLSVPLNVSHHNQVLLGLGMATLVSANGNPVIQVASGLNGVRVAGLLLQAGARPTPTLLLWGEQPSAGDPDNPSALHDVFARVGGPDYTPVQADVMVTINTGHVLVDHVWLWRADHTVTTWGVKNGDNPCLNGLVVNGPDVTAYGVFVEHTLRDLTVWRGERGRTFMYQSELPYDANQSWVDGQYVSYRVADNVTAHEAYGVGVYHFFRDNPVHAFTAIVAPPALMDNFHNSLALYLAGQGTLDHILNDQGTCSNSTCPLSDPDIAHGGWVC